MWRRLYRKIHWTCMVAMFSSVLIILLIRVYYTKSNFKRTLDALSPDYDFSVDIHEDKVDNFAADPHQLSEEKQNGWHIHPETSLRAVPTITTIAIGLAITSFGYHPITADNVEYRSPFLRTMLPTFCKTASKGFHYHFYLAFDANDQVFSDDSFLRVFYKKSVARLRLMCPHGSNFSLHFVQCNHRGHPAWAQSDAMMEAYFDDMDFYYRINDDIDMLSPGWSEDFISALQDYNPPLVGVVGPKHSGGNLDILTVDFVHRTHIDIFGMYYPRLFTDWFADSWMTLVYGRERSIKLPGAKIRHTQEAGRRYRVNYEVEPLWKDRLLQDSNYVQKYIERLNIMADMKLKNGTTKRNVISYSLWGSNPKYTFGMIRNIQLARVYFPGWLVRVYFEHLDGGMSSQPPAKRNIPQRILNKLKLLGAELVEVDSRTTRIPPMMWRFLVADDLQVDYFIVRDADSRLSERDSVVVQQWIESGKSFHCIRDHPSHSLHAVSGGLWGGQPKALQPIIKVPWSHLLRGFNPNYGEDLSFLANAIWPRIHRDAYCHDSVSCTKWPSAHPFPVRRRGTEHIGQVFDMFDNPRTIDEDGLVEFKVPQECSSPNDAEQDQDDVDSDENDDSFFDFRYKSVAEGVVKTTTEAPSHVNHNLTSLKPSTIKVT